MPGPACELHSEADYTRYVFILIGGEKGSSAGKEWFEQEETKLGKGTSSYRADRTFGLPAYSFIDSAEGHAEVAVLKGDLVAVIQFHSPDADLDRLRRFAKRILKRL